MLYTHDQFKPDEAWLVFRFNSLIRIQGKDTDLLLLMDMGSGYIFGQIIVTDELPGLFEVHRLMKDAYNLKKEWPLFLFFTSDDPAEELFRKFAEQKKISFKSEPVISFSSIINPVKQSFYNYQRSGEIEDSEYSEEDQESALSMIPGTYDPCPCASGKKFRYCCQPFFKEIINAMYYAEEGRYRDALLWMDKAKKKAGETPEILCRYAIVYSFYDKVKSDEYLEKCLKAFPVHPRANYIKGIDLKSKGNYEGAVKSYKTAIDNYPPGDLFHLNEVWNNLGSAYFEMKRYADAKAAWEKSLDYLPRDKNARSNLKEMIFENPDVPEDIKKIPSIYFLNSSKIQH